MEENHKELLANCLELLKDSPIVNVEYYYICLSNLCDTINTISRDVNELVDDIERAIEKDTIKRTMHYIKWTRDRVCQIQTISDVIKEKVSLGDFTELENLFYHYQKYKETL